MKGGPEAREATDLRCLVHCFGPEWNSFTVSATKVEALLKTVCPVAVLRFSRFVGVDIQGFTPAVFSLMRYTLVLAVM